MTILAPVIALGSLGLVFGALLGLAAKKLKVEVDERIEEISNHLPGANCGGCGFAGCSALAKAITEKKATPDSCGACTEEAIKIISDIMGIKVSAGQRFAARVMCAGESEFCGERFHYEGISDCHSAMTIAGGSKSCSYGCLGYGSCVSACKFGALSLKNGIAVVNPDLCKCCKACINTCPRGIIQLIPHNIPTFVLCSSKDKGAQMKNICSVGCIGCKICEKNCPHGAITVTDNLASIDYLKCTGCGLCAEKCPKKIIR